MKKATSLLFLWSFFIALVFVPVVVRGADFPPAPRAGAPVNGIQPLSQYGQIQNVQNYSSNPFFNPNSPYNQRMPVPIYARGAELTAGECGAVVSSVVAMQCGMKNNCVDMRLANIRPYIIQSLAALPGHNYVTSCSGFIDSVFSQYMTQSQNLTPDTVAFPTITGVQNFPNPDFKVENPYEIQLTTFKKEYIGRATELAKLQAQNADDTTLVATQMPKTFEDIGFADRNQILATGYEKWKCDPATGRGCAYKTVKIETDAEKYVREQTEMDALKSKIEAVAALEEAKVKSEKTKNFCAWCAKPENQYACASELEGKAAEENPKLIESACKTHRPFVMLWAVKPDTRCGYTSGRTLKIKLDDAICNRTPPQTGCMGNAAKCPDGTCPEQHTGNNCAASLVTANSDNSGTGAASTTYTEESTTNPEPSITPTPKRKIVID